MLLHLSDISHLLLRAHHWHLLPAQPHLLLRGKLLPTQPPLLLRGKLLLIVGELDRNVPPESTMRLAAALIKANKDFDLVVAPGAGHGGGGRYGDRRRKDFFRRHLLGVEPPDRNASQ